MCHATKQEAMNYLDLLAINYQEVKPSSHYFCQNLTFTFAGSYKSKSFGQIKESQTNLFCRLT